MARLFQVSRVTVRRALATLETHGLIEKRQGVGTFVRQHAARQPIHAPMSELLGHMTEVVGETEVRLVEFGYEPAPAPVRALFDSPADALFQRAIRLRCFEDNRILHLTTYIPETIGRRLGQDAMASGSLYDLLLKNGVSFGSIEQVVSATLADPVVAARLQIEVGSPLLQIRRMHFDSRQQPVEYLEQLAAPGSFELRMSLQPGELRRWTP